MGLLLAAPNVDEVYHHAQLGKLAARLSQSWKGAQPRDSAACMLVTLPIACHAGVHHDEQLACVPCLGGGSTQREPAGEGNRLHS